MNVNFAFIRHGYGCHNAMSNLVRNNVISRENGMKFLKENEGDLSVFSSDIVPLNDPVLTNIGVEASIYNGCVINKIFNKLPALTGDKSLKMDTFNVVGCSPLIRCMETAYYMTRKWKNPPNIIYVFPLLREIDESSTDKYSEMSRRTMQITPSYAILPIEEQKKYLKKIGILDYFNFSFVESFPQERLEPGDIEKFMNWFGKYFMNLVKDNENLNVFITTHAGVLRDYSNKGFYNNSGFVINTKYDGQKFITNNYASLSDYSTGSYKIFKQYDEQKYNEKSYYCPSDRCGQLCSVAQGPSESIVKKIGLECDLDDTKQKVKEDDVKLSKIEPKFKVFDVSKMNKEQLQAQIQAQKQSSPQILPKIDNVQAQKQPRTANVQSLDDYYAKLKNRYKK